MIIISLLLAMLVLVAVIYFSVLAPAPSRPTVQLVTSEWAPYSGERIGGNGIASTIVRHVFSQMGYESDIRFMPWQLAESLVAANQRNDGPRVTFPYIKTGQRENHFYYSDSILDVTNAIYFNPAFTPQGSQITRLEDLQHFRILPIEGYAFHPAISPYMQEGDCYYKSNIDAFKALISPRQSVFFSDQEFSDEFLPPGIKRYSFYFTDEFFAQIAAGTREQMGLFYLYAAESLSATQIVDEAILRGKDLLFSATQFPVEEISSLVARTCVMNEPELGLAVLMYNLRPPVVIEAAEVTEQLFRQRQAGLSTQLARAPLEISIELSVLFSRNNPENLAMRDKFNVHLARLKDNTSAYQALIQQARTNFDQAYAVRLESVGQEHFIWAYPYSHDDEQCQMESTVILPKGSQAVITRWPTDFLTFSSANRNTERALMVRIRLVNGPMAQQGEELCVDGINVVLD